LKHHGDSPVQACGRVRFGRSDRRRSSRHPKTFTWAAFRSIARRRALMQIKNGPRCASKFRDGRHAPPAIGADLPPVPADPNGVRHRAAIGVRAARREEHAAST
jgi:hypothetical protein